MMKSCVGVQEGPCKEKSQSLLDEAEAGFRI